MKEFIIDIVKTLIGVFTGGLLTIWVNSVSEKRKIKRDMEIELIKKLNPLLEKFATDVLVAGSYIFTLKDVKDYSKKLESNSFITVKGLFMSESYILYPFYNKFQKLCNKRSKIILSFKDEKRTIYEIAEKYNEYNIKTLLKVNDELREFQEKNFKKYMELALNIYSLKKEINRYYLSEIYKETSLKRLISYNKILKNEKE